MAGLASASLDLIRATLREEGRDDLPSSIAYIAVMDVLRNHGRIEATEDLLAELGGSVYIGRDTETYISTLQISSSRGSLGILGDLSCVLIPERLPFDRDFEFGACLSRVRRDGDSGCGARCGWCLRLLFLSLVVPLRDKRRHGRIVRCFTRASSAPRLALHPCTSSASPCDVALDLRRRRFLLLLDPRVPLALPPSGCGSCSSPGSWIDFDSCSASFDGFVGSSGRRRLP